VAFIKKLRSPNGISSLIFIVTISEANRQYENAGDENNVKKNKWHFVFCFTKTIHDILFFKCSFDIINRNWRIWKSLILNTQKISLNFIKIDIFSTLLSSEKPVLEPVRGRLKRTLEVYRMLPMGSIWKLRKDGGGEGGMFQMESIWRLLWRMVV
jgi:hypothetical protein